MREHRPEHVEQVAATGEVVLDERREHPLAVPQQPVVVAQRGDQPHERPILTASQRRPVGATSARRPREVERLLHRSEQPVETGGGRTDREHQPGGGCRITGDLASEGPGSAITEDAPAPAATAAPPWRRPTT